MKRLISRPARAVFPVIIAIIALLMPEKAGPALELWAAALLARGCSLCAGAALRRAAGAVINAARLRGNFLTAMLLALIGGAAACALSAYALPIGVYAACAGALINVAQLCCDRLYASPDAFSPGLYDVIIALLAAAGLMMSGGDAPLMPAVCLPAALAGCMLLFGLRRGVKLRPGFRVLACAPAAGLKSWLFPALITLGAYVFDTDAGLAATALIGCALLEWLEPNFRRAAAESGAASAAACGFAAAVLAIAAIFPPALHGVPSADSAAVFTELMLALLLAAPLGALAVGVHMDLRRAGMLLTLLAVLALALQPQLTGLDILPYLRWAAASAAAILCALSIPDVRDICIRARARRRRRR